MKKKSQPAKLSASLSAFIVVVLIVGLTSLALIKQGKDSVIQNDQSQKTQQMEYLSPITSNTQYSEVQNSTKVGWKKYTNKIARFSIEFPEKLQVYEEISGEDGGLVSFCNHQVRPNSAGDCKDGVTMSYALPFIDGKGGGCPAADGKKFTMLGKTHSVCLGENYLNLLYVAHPEEISEVSITSRFEQNFTEEEMRTTLATFSFIKKNP